MSHFYIYTIKTIVPETIENVGDPKSLSSLLIINIYHVIFHFL